MDLPHGNEMMIPPETRDFARRLLANEAAAGKSYETTASAMSVCEKLRQSVCALAGVDGYRALLSRALVLARAEAPSLNSLQVTAEGNFQSLGDSVPQADQGNAGEIFIAQLLGLLLNFLGAALTLQLVGDAFPRLESTTESAMPLPFETILQEVQHLNKVSERLVSLAEQHPLAEQALITISANIRDTATLLEVFVRIKSKSEDTQEDEAKQYKM